MAHPKLIEDPSGMIFEYLDEEEAEFLYEEVFVRRSYLRHGLAVHNGAVVIDAGANIGLFSLQCLREAKRVKVYAFEPIPDIYSVLARNLHTSIGSAETGAGPRPVALRVALGAEQDEGKFHFFGSSPGESTRNPEEREQQRRTLLADPEANSWRHKLEPPSAPHPTRTNAPDTRGHDALAGSPAPPSLAVDGCQHNDGGAIREAAAAAAAAVDAEADRNPLRSPAANLHISAGNSLPACSAATSERVCVAQAASRAASRVAGGAEPRMEKGDGFNQAGGRASLRDKGAESEDCGVLEVEEEEEEEEEEDGKQRGESFVCNVVPLSLALGQLGLAAVDLFKVDVEGDELAVLRGIDDEDWPKIHQVALEVHDIDGRLAAAVELLRSAPAAFDEVCWESQGTSEVRGYVMVVPEALRMFMVFAKRRPKTRPTTTTPRAPDSGNDDGRRSHSRGDQGVEGAGSSSRVAASEREGGRRERVGVVGPRFCECVAGGRSSPV